MRILLYTFILLSFSCNGQNETISNEAVYSAMPKDFCSCLSKTNEPWQSFDSCYKKVVDSHYMDLRSFGIDTTSGVGKSKLFNELNLVQNLRSNCYTVYRLLMKYWEELESKKLKFTGAFVSQTRLPSGKFRLILKKLETGEIREFISDSMKVDEQELKQYIPGEENIVVEYEKRKDTYSNKDYDFIIKLITVGAILKITQ